MAAPPVSPQPGAVSAEPAGNEHSNITAAPSAPGSAAAPVSKSQVAGAWVFGAILLGLLVLFLYFPPKVANAVTGFCIEAVITAIFAGLFGYFILGATNQNWNWKITENLSVNIQATGGFALTIGTAALFLGVYYWNGQRPPHRERQNNNPPVATPSGTTPTPATPQANSATPPAPVVTHSDVEALNTKVASTTTGIKGTVQLEAGEQALQKLGYTPGETVKVTISGNQYKLQYVQNRTDAAKGEEIIFSNSKNLAIAAEGKNFVKQHGVEVGAQVEIPKKQ